MNGFTIREARREDCKEIRRLIQASSFNFHLGHSFKTVTKDIIL
jgi:N-acetylglutamate synthase-like GNAT family acetyltransferase